MMAVRVRLRLFELASVLVLLDHIASFVVNAESRHHVSGRNGNRSPARFRRKPANPCFSESQGTALQEQ